MKRDLDLVRKIILAVEDQPSGYPSGDIVIDGYSEEQVGYHCYLIVAQGLAEGSNVTGLGSTSPNWLIHHLTPAGHDFADAARSDGIWTKAKTIIKDKGLSASIDVMKDLLLAIGKGAIGLGAGGA